MLTGLHRCDAKPNLEKRDQGTLRNGDDAFVECWNVGTDYGRHRTFHE